MANPPYRALRVVLGFLSLCMAIGGVVLVFSSKSLILRLFLHPPDAEVSTLFLFTLKEMGGFALMLAVLVFFAARDPVRNVAITDAHGGTMHTLHHAARVSLDAGHPEHVSRTSSLGTVGDTAGAGGLLYYLRPRETQWKPAGDF